MIPPYGQKVSKGDRKKTFNQNFHGDKKSGSKISAVGVAEGGKEGGGEGGRGEKSTLRNTRVCPFLSASKKGGKARRCKSYVYGQGKKGESKGKAQRSLVRKGGGTTKSKRQIIVKITANTLPEKEKNGGIHF